MTDRMEKIFPYLLLAPAVIPLVYVSGLVYPYVAPKTFLLQCIGIIALAVFAYLALSGRQFFYGRLQNRFSWIPAALLVVAYVSSIFGIDFYRSFWGLFDRGDSLLTLTIITVFFYLILISADRQLLERLIKTVAVVAGIVAMIAVLQWVTAGLGGEAWFLPPVSGRIGATFGNAAFLAGYLGMALFVTLVALRDSTGLWRVVYKTSAVLSILAILFAATRGTILALIVAGTVALAYAALKRPSPANAPAGALRAARPSLTPAGTFAGSSWARSALIALVVFAGFFFIFRSELANVPFEPIRRIASISLSDGTVSSRIFVWRNVGAEAVKRSVLGSGAGHIARIFDKVYDPSRIIEQWFDRSHNAFLDYFVQYGIFGLALYLALIGAFAVSAFRMRRRESSDLLNPSLLLLLLILTYAMQNFFVFDTPHSLWLLYALFASLIVLSSDAPVGTLSFKRPNAFVPVSAGGIILLAIIPTIVLPLYANILLTKGYLYHLIDVDRANAYFERGLALGTYADLEYGYQAYDMYTERQAKSLEGQNRVSAYDYALSVLTRNFKKYPYDARTATYLGHVMDTAPPETTIDDSFDRQVLDHAIELSPLRAQAWYMKANISLRKANSTSVGSKERESHYREAIEVLETYAINEPMLSVPRYILATLYYALGDTATAKKFADEALPLYTEADAAAARPAVKYYIAIKDWRNAVRFLSVLAENDPSDYNVLYDLAKVTYLVGDLAAAERIVAELRIKNPDILETDKNFLKAITAYEQSKK